jgi:hypothetical protein
MARLTAQELGSYTPGTLSTPPTGAAVTPRGWLLAINHAYAFFGTTLYVGVLWALHFFWYPTWRLFNVQNYYDQFIPPTSAATRFFTIVVPLMFLALVVMVWSEWKTRHRWTALLALACIGGATYVGQGFIIPVNKTLATHIADPARLTALLQRWMMLNDIRMAIMTVMWLTMMYYFVSKGSLLRSLSGPAK